MKVEKFDAKMAYGNEENVKKDILEQPEGYTVKENETIWTQTSASSIAYAF